MTPTTIAMQGTIHLICKEDGCTLPIAEIQNGVLLIKSRHHGREHINAIAIRDLIQALDKFPEPMLIFQRT